MPPSTVQLAIHGGSPAFPDGPPHWPPDDQAIHQAIEAAYDDGSWACYQGRHGESLAAKLSTMHEAREVRLCATGTVAVELALRGLRIDAGDEVILAAYDFAGNFRAIATVGATPVLVDIDASTYCIAVGQLAAARSERTKAIIVSHLHGGIADMPAIGSFAQQHGLAVVEDACQAPGAVVAGRPAGCWGDVGVMSFGGSKLLTAGRGGALHSPHPDVMQRIRIYSEQGNDAYALSELQAAVLLPQLERLAERNRQRGENADLLCGALQQSGMLATVQNRVPGVPAYYKLPLRPSMLAKSASRDELVAAFCAEGLDVGIGFRGFTHRGSRRCRKVGPLPKAELAAATTMLLHHPILLAEPNEIRRVVEALDKVCGVLMG